MKVGDYLEYDASTLTLAYFPEGGSMAMSTTLSRASFQNWKDQGYVESVDVAPENLPQLDPAGPWMRLVDDQGDVLYVGDAAPGSSTSTPVWRIQRIVLGETISRTYAGASTRFINVWDERLTQTYK